MKNQTNKYSNDLENFILAFPYKLFLPWSDLSVSNKISVEFFIENKALIKKYTPKTKYGDYYNEYNVCQNPNLELSDLAKLDPEDINYQALSSNKNIDVFSVLSLPDAPWDLCGFFANPNFIELFINGEIFVIVCKLKNIVIDEEEYYDCVHTCLNNQYNLNCHINRLYTSNQSILFKNYYDNEIHLHKREDDTTNLNNLIYEINDTKIIKRRSKIIRKFKLNEHYELVRSTMYINRFHKILIISWCLKFLGNDFVKYLKKIKNNSICVFDISQIIVGYFNQDSVKSPFANKLKCELLQELDKSFYVSS